MPFVVMAIMVVAGPFLLYAFWQFTKAVRIIRAEHALAGYYYVDDTEGPRGTIDPSIDFGVTAIPAPGAAGRNRFHMSADGGIVLGGRDGTSKVREGPSGWIPAGNSKEE
jgi:hypothetical protein